RSSLAVIKPLRQETSRSLAQRVTRYPDGPRVFCRRGAGPAPEGALDGRGNQARRPRQAGLGASEGADRRGREPRRDGPARDGRTGSGAPDRGQPMIRPQAAPLSEPMYALNFYSPIVADQLRSGRKTATIRLGDKSAKYRKGMVVQVLAGARYSPRQKIFDAVVD